MGPGGDAIAPTSIQLQNGSTRVRVSYAMLPSGNFTFDLRAPSIFDTSGVALGTDDILDHFSTATYTDTWLGGTSGNWTDGTRWSRGTAPGAEDTALVALDPGATVTYDAHDTAVQGLAIQGGTFDVPTPDGSGPFTIGTLGLDSAARFVVDQSGSDSVDVTSAIVNAGEIDLDAAASNAAIGIRGDVTLSGGGRIVMASTGAGSATIDGEATGQPSSGVVPHGTLDNVDNTIVGLGQIGGQLTLDNEAGGIIEAVGTGAVLSIAPVEFFYGGAIGGIDPGTVDNAGIISADGGSIDIKAGTLADSGTMRAINGGTLEIDGATVDNTGGTISAAAGSRLVVRDSNGQANADPSLGASIQSGTMALGAGTSASISGTLDAVVIDADATATVSGTMALDGVTSDAAIALLNGSTLAGSVSNAGTLTVAGTAAGADTTVTVEGVLTLAGGGTLALVDSGSVVKGFAPEFDAAFARSPLLRADLVAAPAAARIDNVDNTISGAGQIDGTPTNSSRAMELTNEADGVVKATGGTLTLDTLAITNVGTIASNAAGTLVISFTNGGSFDNGDGTSAGRLLASGGTLKIAGDEGQGGTAEIDDGILEYGGAASDAIAFGTGAGQLMVDKIASFSGVLSDFGGGHTLDLGDVTESTITGFVYQPASDGMRGDLVVTHDNGMSSSIAFAGTYTTNSFTYGADSHGGTVVTLKQQ